MSDKVSSTHPVDETPYQPEAAPSSEPLKLHFPHIDLNTSLESLLKYSSNSSNPTAMMPPQPNPPPALEDSWTSLDVSDYTREEDGRSENTDPVSLADLTSTNDSESVAEEEAQSIASEEPDTEMATPEQSMHPLSSIKPQSPVEAETEDLEDTILLERSAVQEVPTEVDVVYRRPLSNTQSTADSQTAIASYETIRMTLSQHHLPQNGTPFRVAYFGTASAREAQDLVLGKVGAALVASPQSSSNNVDAPCYHVAPTEFGSGSKPYFAHLIPSQAQIIVDDITILKERQPGCIDIALKDGTILSSSRVRKGATKVDDSWFPNLLVIHIAYDDLATDDKVISSVREFARRHGLPLIMVSNETLFGDFELYDVRTLHKVIEYSGKGGQPSIFKPSPIDLGSFLNLDAEQLNKHLALICRDDHQSTGKTVNTLSNITEYLKSYIPWLITPESADRDGYCYVLQKADTTQSREALPQEINGKTSPLDQPTSHLSEVTGESNLRNCLALVSFSILTWFLVVIVRDTYIRLYSPPPLILPVSSSDTQFETSSSPPIVALASRYSSALATSSSRFPKIVDTAVQPIDDEPAPLTKNIWEIINLKSSNADTKKEFSVVTSSTGALSPEYSSLDDISATVRWLTHKTTWILNSTQTSLTPAFDQVKQLLANSSLHQSLIDRYQNKTQMIDAKITDAIYRLQNNCQDLNARILRDIRAKTERWNDLVAFVQNTSNKQFREINREPQRILHQAQKQVNKLARDSTINGKTKIQGSRRWWRRSWMAQQ